MPTPSSGGHKSRSAKNASRGKSGGGAAYIDYSGVTPLGKGPKAAKGQGVTKGKSKRGSY